MAYKLGEVAEILLEIATEIANVPDAEYAESCPFCGAEHGYLDLVHRWKCPVRRLRSLIKEIDE